MCIDCAQNQLRGDMYADRAQVLGVHAECWVCADLDPLLGVCHHEVAVKESFTVFAQ